MPRAAARGRGSEATVLRSSPTRLESDPFHHTPQTQPYDPDRPGCWPHLGRLSHWCGSTFLVRSEALGAQVARDAASWLIAGFLRGSGRGSGAKAYPDAESAHSLGCDGSAIWRVKVPGCAHCASAALRRRVPPGGGGQRARGEPLLAAGCNMLAALSWSKPSRWWETARAERDRSGGADRPTGGLLPGVDEAGNVG